MRNKIKKRVDRYFGFGTWDKLTEAQKDSFVDIGAHGVWKQHKAKTLLMPERESPIYTKDDGSITLNKEEEGQPKILTLHELIDSEPKQVKKGLLGRILGR